VTHSPRKRFGQNFLRDPAIIDNILASAQPKVDEHWVEIGPGQGALTEPLLKQVNSLDIIELDRDLVALLEKKFQRQTGLRIHSADALKFDFSALALESKKIRIIGNLPYNISTPLMFHLLTYASVIEDMHFMLQKEVVERICASSGSKRYGRLTIMMAYYCAAEPLFDVPPESFDPAPKVMSSIIRLLPHRQPPVTIHHMNHFNRIVTEAFSQRRKTLRNALKKLISEDQYDALAIDASARPEMLTLSEFAKLSNLLQGAER